MDGSKYDKIYAEDLIDLKNRISTVEGNLTSLNTNLTSLNTNLTSLNVDVGELKKLAKLEDLVYYDGSYYGKTAPSQTFIADADSCVIFSDFSLGEVRMFNIRATYNGTDVSTILPKCPDGQFFRCYVGAGDMMGYSGGYYPLLSYFSNNRFTAYKTGYASAIFDNGKFVILKRVK